MGVWKTFKDLSIDSAQSILSYTQGGKRALKNYFGEIVVSAML